MLAVQRTGWPNMPSTALSSFAAISIASAVLAHVAPGEGHASSPSSGRKTHQTTTLFDSSDLGALRLRFDVGARPVAFTVYPGAGTHECWVKGKAPRLRTLLKDHVEPGFSAMPLSCLFRGYRPETLHSLANSGNSSAQFLYASLLAENRGCSDRKSLAVLNKLSDAGFGPASISAGNFLQQCGDVSGALGRYQAAGVQDFISAESYWRELLNATFRPVVPKP